ncbi:hypothetical protein [Halalkalicoccus jeotgali]|uniref:DUF8136 domain-containing protein n=1 Tax=Halalkalicoccus jeotgali (strain DSM 18796 / CECT 7217 / JCM 14584 / KCTC 4019 / B3) TaxID=795797 RepID=D8J6N3_HALJB|nr:hypothetical protein [Halalkalicoccus jeotgali]ADJ13910.1 hypothetical protein HacjB3_02585 [Halalkalicoccus jeotgali B3]
MTRNGNRSAILESLKDGIDGLQRAIETARPETPEEQRVQLRQYYELGYLANQCWKLQRDTDIDEMSQRMALLEDKTDMERY